MKKINLILPAILLALSCQEDVDLQTSNDAQLVSEDNYAVYLNEQGNKVPLSDIEVDSILDDYTNRQSKNASFTDSDDEVSVAINNTWAPRAWTFVGDFNGDGREDFASLSGNDAHMKFGQGSPPATYANFTYDTWDTDGKYGGAGYTFAGDFDGNGRSDIVSFSGGKAYLKFSMPNNNFLDEEVNVTNSWGGSGYTFVGDFNGDGRDDIASLSGTAVYLKQSAMSGTNFAFSNRNLSTNGVYGPSNYTFAADYNNDGRDDIVSISGRKILVKRSESTPSGVSFVDDEFDYMELTLNQRRQEWGGDFVWVGDENGDGFDEFVSAISTNLWTREFTSWIYPQKYRDSRSPGTTEPTTTTFNIWSSAGWEWMMDINGDGTDELITIIYGTAYLH